MVKDRDAAYHVRGTPSMYPSWLAEMPEGFCSKANLYSIGIELEMLPSDNTFTDAQYKALASLLAKLCNLYGIAYSRDRIITHASLQSDRRDPRGLDWHRVNL